MTAAAKQRLKLIGAITALASSPFVIWGATAFDSRFVKQNTYTLDRLRDSLNYRADLREIRDGISELRADCRKRGGCQR